LTNNSCLKYFQLRQTSTFKNFKPQPSIVFIVTCLQLRKVNKRSIEVEHKLLFFIHKFLLADRS